MHPPGKNDGPPQYVAPGHFYSPIPSVEDVDRAIAARQPADSLLGIDLREDEQMRLLQRLAKFYPEIPFESDRSKGLRFGFDNPSYSWCDGILLFCMIRALQPRRIIEVGSGHSSCLILDTNELFFGGSIEVTFVDPYPELLLGLLRPGEVERTDIVAKKLQDTDPELFASLRAKRHSIYRFKSRGESGKRCPGALFQYFTGAVARRCRAPARHLCRIRIPSWVATGRARLERAIYAPGFSPVQYALSYQIVHRTYGA